MTVSEENGRQRKYMRHNSNSCTGYAYLKKEKKEKLARNNSEKTRGTPPFRSFTLSLYEQLLEWQSTDQILRETWFCSFARAALVFALIW